MSPLLKIEKLVQGGDGMGRLPDGRVVFAAPVVPGDVIAGDLVQHKRVWRMPTYTLVSSSPQRQNPPCRHAAVTAVSLACGGCDWQHLSPSVQHHWKTDIVRESFQRIGKIKNPSVQPVLADDSWAYRHTVTWHVARQQGQPRLAYYARYSHDEFFFETCPVLPSTLLQVAERLNTTPTVLEHCQTVKARANSQGEVLLGLDVPGSLAISVLQKILKPPIVGIWQLDKTPTCLLGQPYLTQHFLGQPFHMGVHHFMQTHPAVVNSMLGWLKTVLKNDLSTATTLLDAYCGTGVFGLSVLLPHHQLTGVEGNEESIELARKNALAQHVAHQATWHPNSMEQFVTHCAEGFDLAICDPPRTGMKPQVLMWLNQSICQTLVYISCNPATLARDSRILLDAGWQLDVVQPFDMFPQTHHVETIAVFRRRPL